MWVIEMVEACRLLNLFVYGNLLENGIVLLQLKTLCGVLAVFGSDISRGAGHAAGLVLGALEDYLHAISFSFLCHCCGEDLNVEVNEFVDITLLGCFLDGGIEAFLVDGAEAGGRDGEGNPGLLFNPEELLIEEVDIKFTLGAALGVRNIVADHSFFACDLTNL